MLIGQYKHNLDSKGRLIIPSKFRLKLDGGFIMTKGLDGCLFLYPKKEWLILNEKLKALPLSNKNARAFVRFFMAGACEIEMDKQGRILIPENLRTYACLEKETNIIGLSTRLEIWSSLKWKEYNDCEQLSEDIIQEKMCELGI